MTTLRKMASKKALTISAMLGAGILLSAMLVASPSTFTWAQQQMIANNSSSNPTDNHTNQLGNPIPKINGSVNVVENIKNVFKEIQRFRSQQLLRLHKSRYLMAQY